VVVLPHIEENDEMLMRFCKEASYACHYHMDWPPETLHEIISGQICNTGILFFILTKPAISSVWDHGHAKLS